MVLLPLEWAWLRWMRPRVEQGVRRLRERSSQLSSFLVETIGGMKAIQSMAVEEREARQLGKHNRNYLRDLLSLQITEFATQAVASTLTSSTRDLVFIAGGYWVIEGQMQLGSLIAFSTYLGMAVGPVNTLLGLYTFWVLLQEEAADYFDGGVPDEPEAYYEEHEEAETIEEPYE